MSLTRLRKKKNAKRGTTSMQPLNIAQEEENEDECDYADNISLLTHHHHHHHHHHHPRHSSRDPHGPAILSLQESLRHKSHVNPKILVVAVVVFLVYTIIHKPSQNQSSSSSLARTSTFCTIRVTDTRQRNSREKICPRLDSSILYGEWFRVPCQNNNNSTQSDCNNDCTNAVLPNLKGCNNNNNGDNDDENFLIERRPQPKQQSSSSSSSSSFWSQFPYVDPKVESACFVDCFGKHPETQSSFATWAKKEIENNNIHCSIAIPDEWAHYQLMDQSERLCRLRDCPNNGAKPTCTADDLDLPRSSLARVIGTKCQDYFQTHNYNKAQKGTLELWDQMVWQAVAEKQKQQSQWQRPGKDDLVIHVRVGVVVDGSAYSVQELLASPRLYYPEYPDSFVYVKPFSYYDPLPDEVIQKASTIYIVAATHAGWSKDFTAPLPLKSCFYVHALANYFQHQRKAKSVKLRLGGHPDEDFIFLLSSHWFVPSGGGFSNKIAHLLETKNDIIEPEQPQQEVKVFHLPDP